MRLLTAAPIVYLALACVVLQAAEPVIGLAVSQGGLEINRAFVEGNGNVTNGATIKSDASPARIRLTNGNRATLGVRSQARVFTDRVLLEGGQLISTAGRYRAEVLGFNVIPAGQNTQAALELQGGRVQIAALNGSVNVTDAAGVMVARVNPGRALVVEPASSTTAGRSMMRGVLRREAGRFVMRDEVTNLDVELRGGRWEKQIGSQVVVNGRAEASPNREAQVVFVSRLQAAQDVDQQSGGNRPDQGGNRPDSEKPGTGMSNGAKVAIVLVLAGGAAGGVVAATASKKESVSR